MVKELKAAEGKLKELMRQDHPLREDSGALHRFLIARRLEVNQAAKMIEAHVTWRAANLPMPMTAEIRQELQKGKYYVHGVDGEERPIIVVRSGRFDPKERDLQTAVNSLVFVIEQAVRKLPDGVSQFAVLYDRTGFSVGKNWDFELIKGANRVLSDNYPERLGGAYVYPCGMVLYGLWKIISPVLDPRTRQKIRLVTSNEELLRLVPAQFVPQQYGGESDFVFDPESVPPVDEAQHALRVARGTAG
jgi:hypothetical protein